jgi:hypothetical protein
VVAVAVAKNERHEVEVERAGNTRELAGKGDDSGY